MALGDYAQGFFLKIQSQFFTPKMMQLVFHEKNAKNTKVYTKYAKVFTKNTKLYAKNAKVYVARLVRATRTCMSV
ncbi:hypothetical protein [Desulfovibrio sp. QI0442]